MVCRRIGCLDDKTDFGNGRFGNEDSPMAKVRSFRIGCGLERGNANCDLQRACEEPHVPHHTGRELKFEGGRGRVGLANTSGSGWQHGVLRLTEEKVELIKYPRASPKRSKHPHWQRQSALKFHPRLGLLFIRRSAKIFSLWNLRITAGTLTTPGKSIHPSGLVTMVISF